MAKQDPNVLLKRLRELRASIRGDEDGEDMSGSVDWQDVDDFGQFFDELDKHLSDGGGFPADWQVSPTPAEVEMDPLCNLRAQSELVYSVTEDAESLGEDEVRAMMDRLTQLHDLMGFWLENGGTFDGKGKRS